MTFYIDDYPKFSWYFNRSWQSGNYSKEAHMLREQMLQLSVFIEGREIQEFTFGWLG